MTLQHPLPALDSASLLAGSAEDLTGCPTTAFEAPTPVLTSFSRSPILQVVEAACHFGDLMAPYVDGFQQLILRAQPHINQVFEHAARLEAIVAPTLLRAQPLMAALVDRFVAWEALAAPALLRVAPLLERAYAAAQALQALRDSQVYGPCLCAAEAVDIGDRRAIVRFTREVLRLPEKFWQDAAVVLTLDDDWWDAADPIEELRRRTRGYASRIAREDRGNTRLVARLVAMTAPPDPDAEQRWVETVLDLKAAFASVGLRAETGLALATLDGYDRAGAAQVLGLTVRELDAGWKRVQRKREPLVRRLK
ncbi:MAG: hypothetical protein JWM10_3141 [Myxococcaceae bacterium]|nr:hypothetical protein [Myxococcaceae bacterium]